MRPITLLCVSGNSVTPVLVATFNAQTSVYVPSGAVIANAWNFFGYTVCCSGGTQLVQNLTVNGNSTSLVGGTYAPLTVVNIFVGHGNAPYNNYFQGKSMIFGIMAACCARWRCACCTVMRMGRVWGRVL